MFERQKNISRCHNDIEFETYYHQMRFLFKSSLLSVTRHLGDNMLIIMTCGQPKNIMPLALVVTGAKA